MTAITTCNQFFDASLQVFGYMPKGYSGDQIQPWCPVILSPRLLRAKDLNRRVHPACTQCAPIFPRSTVTEAGGSVYTVSAAPWIVEVATGPSGSA